MPPKTKGISLLGYGPHGALPCWSIGAKPLPWCMSETATPGWRHEVCVEPASLPGHEPSGGCRRVRLWNGCRNLSWSLLLVCGSALGCSDGPVLHLQNRRSSPPGLWSWNTGGIRCSSQSSQLRVCTPPAGPAIPFPKAGAHGVGVAWLRLVD